MTNKTISLTIPNDDPIALHEFGAAMQRMAHSHGHPVVVPREVTDRAVIAAQTVITGRKSEINRPVDTSGTRDDVHDRLVELQRGVLVDTDKAQLAALGSLGQQIAAALNDDDAEPVTGVLCERTDTIPSHLDSDGLPWDARIHASSKERNADDTWRARRKPSDMDAGQWAEFQGQVRTELRALMELPVELEELRKQVETIEESPTRDTVVVYYTNADDGIGYKHVVRDKSVEQAVAEVHELFNVATIKDVYLNNELQSLVSPVVVEPVEPEPIVVTPPPVVAPPAPVEPVAPVAPPAPTNAAPTEFVPFLQWVTGNGYTAEQVNAALLPHGLTAVPQLQQRPDLIPQVYATLTAGV